MKNIDTDKRNPVVGMGDMLGMVEGLRKLPHVLDGLGFDGLRPGQDRAVKAIMACQDSIVILPTATGKSACFIVPTLCMGWRAIIIYPLLSLMRDQATSMQRRGLMAAAISSQETDAHNAAALRDWASGDLQFMLVSPERFSNQEWAQTVRQYPPDLTAMDECWPGDTYVMTEFGYRSFLDLWETFDAGLPLPKAKSRNSAGAIEWRQITKVFRNAPNRLVRVGLREREELVCTPGHVWFTERGEVQAGHLVLGDRVYAVGGGERQGIRDLNPDQKQLAVGSYLAEVNKVEDAGFSDEHLFDMEVEGNHNYFVVTRTSTGGYLSGNAALVHNCHTFHDWADTFRHGYKSCGKLIQELAPKVVAALSATLSEEAEAEVREGLGLQGAQLIYHYPRRENLILSTEHFDDANAAYPWVARNCQGPTIVYASTRKRTEQYAEAISRYTSRPVYFYHGGMSRNDRAYQQDKFMGSHEAIVVATNAFGMGVDKQDIRNVIHLDVPGTLVALAQECGRAGRDGKDSHCIIVPTAEGVRTRRHFIRCGNPTERDVRAVYNAARRMREGARGAVMARREDLAREAGVDPFAMQSIMTFCLGENIFSHDAEAARLSRVKFADTITSLTKVESETRDALFSVGYEEKGWLCVDMEALAEQLSKETSTVMSRLRKMHDAGKIEWVRASTRAPLRVGVSPDDVPRSSFERLDAKAQQAEGNLQAVMEYCETADDAKHDFLEGHLNR
jgi:superfamily II DNA helicase RecQ